MIWKSFASIACMAMLPLMAATAGRGAAIGNAQQSAPQGTPSDTVTAADTEALRIAADPTAADSIPPVTGDSAQLLIPDSRTVSLPVPKTNPVDIDREAPAAPPMHYYDRHGEPLQTPVRFLAELDTVTKAKAAPTYRAFNGVSIGANFFDAVMMVIGQRRASFDVWADCSVHNWFFPVVEVGVAFSNAWPDDGRCNFKVAPSLYARIGMNYNFLYKSNPDYQFFLGLRAGWSSFSYDIYGIQAGSEYYVADGPTQMTGLSSTAFYGQALAGLKVKLWRGLFMGWSVRYNFNFHQSYGNPDYPAWFTPGRGTSTPIAATFSIGYTFGQRPKRELPGITGAIADKVTSD
ncbi:MAG: hypothetical protein K2O78_03865 [Muribaculaceae bacterium]|nr:hypothetical protein [Muribaculaceae bacterium]MDE7080772.1 hypothetical protein [Muribaculaceae bacterium]